MITIFTPLLSFGGGLVIGLAVVLLMWVTGRIFGATGVLSGFIVPTSRHDAIWRFALLAGMISAPVFLYGVSGHIPEITVPASPLMLIVGGVMVGLGVTYGGGCTSGHGICGLARFSLRSLIATLCFMATAFITVFIVRHLI